jgi:hypothetical protein
LIAWEKSGNNIINIRIVYIKLISKKNVFRQRQTHNHQLQVMLWQLVKVRLERVLNSHDIRF